MSRRTFTLGYQSLVVAVIWLQALTEQTTFFWVSAGVATGAYSAAVLEFFRPGLLSHLFAGAPPDEAGIAWWLRQRRDKAAAQGGDKSDS